MGATIEDMDREGEIKDNKLKIVADKRGISNAEVSKQLKT